MNSAENGTARLALPARRATISGGISNDPNLPQPSLDSDDDDMTMVAGTARLALPARRADSDDDDMTMVAGTACLLASLWCFAAPGFSRALGGKCVPSPAAAAASTCT